MFSKGAFLIFVGLGCIAAPGAAMLYEEIYAKDETAPNKMLTRQAKESACIKDSVQIAGVWVGCKATSKVGADKTRPSKLMMNSRKNNNRPSSGSMFIRVN